MSENKYLELGVAAVENMLNIFNLKAAEAIIAGDDAAVAKCHAEIKLISAALEEKTPKPELNASFSAGTQQNASVLSVQKFVESQVNSISKFEPGVEVSIFLQACDNAFARVKTMPGGEQLLVQYLPSALAQDYQTAWNAFSDGKNITKFTEFTDYMKTTYASGVSTFQLLDKFDQLQKEPTESFPGYAVKVANKVAVLTTEVIAKFEKAKGSPMTREDVFRMIGGVLMIREVRKIPDAYTSVMTQVKDDFDATSIGQLAATFLTLKEKNDQVFGQTASVNYAGRNPNKTRIEKPCFKDGHCDFPGCRFIHKKQARPPMKSETGSRGGQGGRQNEQSTRQQNNTRKKNKSKGPKKQESVNVVEELDDEDELGDHGNIFSVGSSRIFRH